MFSGDHLLPNTQGKEVMTWSWKQKLVGVSRHGQGSETDPQIGQLYA